MSGQPKAGFVGTVGALRAHLAGLPDDARVLAQVKANDGQVWNVGMDVGPVIGAKPPAVGCSMSHPRLRALVEGDAPTMCAACLGHRHNDCDHPDHACGCPECARAFGGVKTGANPVDALERAAEERAAVEGRAVDRESFARARAYVDEKVPAGFEPPDPGRVRPEVLEMGRKIMDAHAETMWKLAISECEDLTAGKALAWAREADDATTRAYNLEELLADALGYPVCRERCGAVGCRPCNLVASGNAAREGRP